MSIWSVLGIEPTDDLSDIKRAYARKLKTTRPDQDPLGYQRLREAFEGAKQEAEISAQNDFIEEFEATEDASSSPWKMQIHVEPLTENAPVIDTSLAQEIRLTDTVTDIINGLMDDETEGLKRLRSTLSGDVVHNLRLREVFSQELAAQLSEREGLYSALLMKVSAVMGWEIDHYQPEGISSERLASLHDQIEKTEAEQYWEQLKRNYQDSALNRKRFHLLTAANIKPPWWTKWEPVFLEPLYHELNSIKMHFPSLLPRINAQLVKAHSETRWTMNWGTMFLTLFWGVLIILGTRDDPHQFRDRCVLIAVISSFIYGYNFCRGIFQSNEKAMRRVEIVLSVVSVGVLIKIFMGLCVLFTHNNPDPHFEIYFGLLCLISFICLCVMAPKQWRWYNTPFNAMILLVILPWRVVKVDGWLYGIIICILMLLLYSLLIAVALK